ncbi:LysR substrate-binding domain-containing protein [Sphingomonas sp. NCPPB 2930]
MHDLNDMFFFAKVVEHGGFSAAARALGVQTSRLSRRVAELEEQLGVRLLQRSTRRVAVTEVGQRFYQHCAALAAEAQAAQDTVDSTRSAPQGLVRLSCPTAFLQNGVSDILTRFLQQHPRVRLHVEATNRRVDVIEEGFDLALRVRTPPLDDSGLVVRILTQSRVMMVASPALLAERGRPARLEDLDAMPTMGAAWASGRHAWSFVTPDGSSASRSYQPRLAVDDFTTLRQAALDGIGIVYLPQYLVQDALDGGLLEQVLPGYTLLEGIAHVVFPSRRGLVPAVRSLIDALVAGYAGHPPV